MVLAVFGGIVGILLGLAIAGWATYVMVVPFTVNPSIVALGFVFSRLIGLVFGNFPARRASIHRGAATRIAAIPQSCERSSIVG
ncbi:MAG TPA: hypothetical protein VM144_17080 [Aestuariivirga sp.]|nr:hypothetical protein [Aestuariivirga sp.]